MRFLKALSIGLLLAIAAAAQCGQLVVNPTTGQLDCIGQGSSAGGGGTVIPPNQTFTNASSPQTFSHSLNTINHITTCRDSAGNEALFGVLVGANSDTITYTGTQTFSCVAVGGLASGYLPSYNTDILTGPVPSGTISNEVHKNLSIANGATCNILSTGGSGGACSTSGTAITGAGYISELFVASTQYFTQVTITVDGEATPSIQADIADLLGENYLDSQPAFFGKWVTGSNNGVGNPGGTLRIPIPFSTSVLITLHNHSGGTAIVTCYATVHTGVPNTWVNTQRLHLAVASASGIAANAETDLVNVTTAKPGRLVGVAWLEDSFPGSATPRTAPLEGAFKMYLDGASSANYASSGSEDFFGAGWYFNNTTTFGTGSTNTLAPASSDVVMTINSGGNTWGAQRFFINDPIAFTNALRVSWTCGNTAAIAFTGTCTLHGSTWYYTQN